MLLIAMSHDTVEDKLRYMYTFLNTLQYQVANDDWVSEPISIDIFHL